MLICAFKKPRVKWHCENNVYYRNKRSFKISYTYYKIILFSAPCYDERIIFKNRKILLDHRVPFSFDGGTLSSLLHITIIEKLKKKETNDATPFSSPNLSPMTKLHDYQLFTLFKAQAKSKNSNNKEM